MDRDVARLEKTVPDPVRRVCRVLSDAGFEAYAVGGAVRDALLGREPGDWDVATSAHPPEVVALFRRTIPTGIQHGTVTVLLGRGRDRTAVEVTTFRGEGAYSDARRPDRVVFGVPLEEDLARRDFVVNAIAYDPIARVIHDPFGGRADLARRVLRAVGDPIERFREDGLRVVRAVRFVSTLGFDLDPATEEAIPRALESLAKVSRERIRVELTKLLASDDPARGLAIAWRRGVVELVLPELAGVAPAPVLARVAAAPPDPPLRLGALVLDLGDPAAADRAMRRLTLSNEDRERVVRMVRFGRGTAAEVSDPELRAFLGRVGRAAVPDLIALWTAVFAAEGDRDRRRLAERAEEILEAGDPLAVTDLALGGADVMRLCEIPPGREVGRVLAALLERAQEDPSQNRRDRLEALVPEVLASLRERG